MQDHNGHHHQQQEASTGGGGGGGGDISGTGTTGSVSLLATSDLLSAALDEAGLDDFLSLDNEPFPTPPDQHVSQEEDEQSLFPVPMSVAATTGRDSNSSSNNNSSTITGPAFAPHDPQPYLTSPSPQSAAALPSGPGRQQQAVSGAAVRYQLLPVTAVPAVRISAPTQLTTASGTVTGLRADIQPTTTATLPAGTVLRPLVSNPSANGNHVIRTVDGRTITIRPAAGVRPVITAVTTSSFSSSPTAGNIQVIKKADGTSQYMIIRKATPVNVTSSSSTSAPPIVVPNAGLPFLHVTPDRRQQQQQQQQHHHQHQHRHHHHHHQQPIRISSDQVLQLKNAINNMNRAAAAASGSTAPNTPVIMSHSGVPVQQLLLPPPQKVVLRTKSYGGTSGPSSPSPAVAPGVSLLATGGPLLPPATGNSEVEEAEDLAEEEEDDHFQAETYADYMPMKLKIGVKHPDPVVETASLSSVHPPNVWYRMAIGEDVIDSGRLSALQLESITYACQQHEQFLKDGSRAGFLLGDGAGVGKGRTLAGMIHENYLLGRKRAIWLSVSNDLRYDAERDLRDIGAKKIAVFPLNKFRYAKISGKENGGVKKGVIFATYSSLIGESHNAGLKYRTRLKQLLHWCGEDFDGVIVFDECHKAKNLCPTGSSKPTKTGLTVLELQRQLPKARIVYASATGASEPKNMAYMVRLGLWGAGTSFPEFSDFVSTVEKRGVGAMELVAIDMKLRGVYIARQLSFSGVAFRIEEIKLSKKFTALYDESVAIWVDAKNKIDKALELMEDDAHIKKSVWGQFWAAHQRFFKYLCIAAKVKHAVNLSRDALKANKCVVIGLQATGEAKTLEALEESGGELTDFVSTAKAVFHTLIEKHFPAPNRKKTLALLNRGSTGGGSIFENLGISVNGGGSKRSLNPVEEIMRKFEKSTPTADPKSMSSVIRKSGLWTCSDSEEEGEEEGQERGKNGQSGDRDSVFDSDSDSDADDFVSVSEGSDIDEMWDNFASGVQEKSKKKAKAKKRKAKKRKKSSSAGGGGKRKTGSKKAKVEKAAESYDALLATKAEFMSDEALDLCEKMRDSLLEAIEELSPRLPPNTLDELIDEMGGPDNVAEMTGRKGRVTMNDSGNIQYETRTENDVALELLNVTEKQRFMDGEKEVAIISEAASSGISLHSDKRAKNRKRRVHITIELPWSADRAIQQFGRTHRSNQTSAPEYIFLISDLAGEQRFASIVAKRLESLGALTHGDRRATESRDLSKYNIDNKYGRQALEIVMKSIVGLERPWVTPPETEFANFFRSTRTAFLGVGLVVKREDGSHGLEKDFNSIAKFLNRLLGIEVELQNAIFQYFTETLEAVVKQAKKVGRFDMGIMDLTSDSQKIEAKSRQAFYHKHSTGAAKVELHEVAVERGMSWDEAKALSSHCKSDEGFYLTNAESKKADRVSVFLAVADASVKTFSKQVFRIYRPNTGLQSKTETATSLKESSGFKKPVTAAEAEAVWQRIYAESATKCSHEVRSGKCHRKASGQLCDVGLRQRVYHILSGSVLSLWETIEKTLPPGMTAASKLQMARLKTPDGQRVIGTLVPEKAVPLLVAALSDKPRVETAAAVTGKAQGTSLLVSKSEASDTATGEAPEKKAPALSVPIFNTAILD